VGWTGAWDKSAVQRLPGRGTHESSEERVDVVEAPERLPTFDEERILFTFRHFLEDSHRLYPQITDCTPKLHIVPHSRFLPRKKRLWGMGYGVQFSVHPKTLRVSELLVEGDKN